MKNLFFAALAALSLGMATIPAYAQAPVNDLSAATTIQQQGAFSGGGN